MLRSRRLRRAAVVGAVAGILAALAASASVATASTATAAEGELLVHPADRRRPAVHGRPRRVRRQHGQGRQARDRPSERRAQEGGPVEEDQGRPRRLTGRPNAGDRGRRGREEGSRRARQRHHRRDGVRRDDPDGAVGDDPEPHHPHLADRERAAADVQLPGGKGWVWRAYPSDNLQGRVLAEAALQKFGKGATINVGARNDAFGTALEQLFVAQWKSLGGKIGVDISWNPDQPTFDTEAGQLVSGNPAGWVIIDFPADVREVRPVARAHRQVGRHEDAHDRGAEGRPDARRDRRSRPSASREPPQAPRAARRATRSTRSGTRT